MEISPKSAIPTHTRGSFQARVTSAAGGGGGAPAARGEGATPYRRFARAASAVTIIIGASGLVGWSFEIPTLTSVLPEFVTMKVNTAISLVLAGTSLLLQVCPTPPRRRLAGLLSLLVAAIGVLTVVEYGFDIDLGIDQLLHRVPPGPGDSASPGRMALNTALSFAMIGAALFFRDSGMRSLRVLSDAMVIAVLLVSYVAVTGYWLSVTALYGVAGYASMALNTAIGFSALSVGLLASRPERGVVAILAQDNSAGAVVRRLVPFILVVPLAVARMLLEAQRRGTFANAFALALMVAVVTSAVAAFALWNARASGAWESERRRASEQFRLAIEAASTGMLMTDGAGRIVLLNAQIETLFGYPRVALLGRPVEMLVPERLRAQHEQDRLSFWHDPKTRAMGTGREVRGLRSDGTEIPIEIGLTPLETPEGSFVLSSIVDVTERRRAAEQFALAIEAAPTGMIMTDNQGQITVVNTRAEQLFGYEREELVGKTIELLIPHHLRQNHRELRSGFLRRPEFRSMGLRQELHGLRKDGTTVPVEIGLNPLHTPQGTGVLCSVVDMTQRKRAEQERDNLLGELQQLNCVLEQRVEERTAALAATLQEREVLLQEVHHRVKNNLSVIVSLMEMQARLLQSVEGRSALNDCQGRVRAIALIHEKLYQSRNYADVPFAEYLRGLAGDIFNAIGVSPSMVTLALTVEDAAVSMEQAIPCGLVLNELVTNALKHAFPGGRRGSIRVEFGPGGAGRMHLTVADDGVGLPPGFDPRGAKSLGWRLVMMLTKQLNGRLTVGGERGTTVELEFAMNERAAA